jgi:hypothetical protein
MFGANYLCFKTAGSFVTPQTHRTRERERDRRAEMEWKETNSEIRIREIKHQKQTQKEI